jgi:hypothetical protein
MKLLPSCETSVAIYYSTRWNLPPDLNIQRHCSEKLTSRVHNTECCNTTEVLPIFTFHSKPILCQTLFREQPMWKRKTQISWNSVSVCSCIFDKWMSCHIYLQIIQGACHTKMLVTPVLWNTITFILLLPLWRIIEFIAITVVGVECELIPAEPVTVNPW